MCIEVKLNDPIHTAIAKTGIKSIEMASTCFIIAWSNIPGYNIRYYRPDRPADLYEEPDKTMYRKHYPGEGWPCMFLIIYHMICLCMHKLYITTNTIQEHVMRPIFSFGMNWMNAINSWKVFKKIFIWDLYLWISIALESVWIHTIPIVSLHAPIKTAYVRCQPLLA